MSDPLEIPEGLDSAFDIPEGAVGLALDTEPIGHCVHSEGTIGVTLWEILSDEKKMEAYSEQAQDPDRNVRVRRLSTIDQLKRELSKTDPPDMPRGATRFIEMPAPKLTDEEIEELNRYNYRKKEWAGDRLLELPEWCFRSVAQAAAYLDRNPDKREVYVFRGGGMNPREDRREDAAGNCKRAWRDVYDNMGLFESHDAYDDLMRLIPSSMHVYDGDDDLTEIVASRSQAGVPVQGGCVVRRVPDQRKIFFRVVRLKPGEYRRALEVADRYRDVRHKTPKKKMSARNLICMYQFCQLAGRIAGRADRALPCSIYNDYYSAYSLEGSLHNVEDAIRLAQSVVTTKDCFHKKPDGTLDEDLWDILRPIYEAKEWFEYKKDLHDRGKTTGICFALDFYKRTIAPLGRKCVRLQKKQERMQRNKEEAQRKLKKSNGKKNSNKEVGDLEEAA